MNLCVCRIYVSIILKKVCNSLVSTFHKTIVACNMHLRSLPDVCADAANMTFRLQMNCNNHCQCCQLKQTWYTYHRRLCTYILWILHKLFSHIYESLPICCAQHQYVSHNFPPLLEVQVWVFEENMLVNAGNWSLQHVLNMGSLLSEIDLASAAIHNVTRRWPVILAWMNRPCWHLIIHRWAITAHHISNLLGCIPSWFLNS